MCKGRGAVARSFFTTRRPFSGVIFEMGKGPAPFCKEAPFFFSGSSLKCARGGRGPLLFCEAAPFFGRPSLEEALFGTRPNCRLALVLVCVLFGGGFVCRGGGCSRRLVLVLLGRVALVVSLRAMHWLWSRAAVSAYFPCSAPRAGRQRRQSNEFSLETSLV